MIAALDLTTLSVAGIWMVIGLLIYFLYSRKHSVLRNQPDEEEVAGDGTSHVEKTEE
jgi:preprotein translocase subunit SecG